MCEIEGFWKDGKFIATTWPQIPKSMSDSEFLAPLLDVDKERERQAAREAGRRDRRPLKFRTDMQGRPVE